MESSNRNDLTTPPKLEESRSFLRSVLLPALKDRSCIINDEKLSRLELEDALSDDEDEVESSQIIAHRTSVEELFTKGVHVENNYFVSLNMVSARLRYVEDILPYVITIISHNNQNHIKLDGNLDFLAKNDPAPCHFEHNLKVYKKYEFGGWVSQIELDQNNLNFLKKLFAGEEDVLKFLGEIEQKIFASNAKERGYQILIMHLTEIGNVKSNEELKEHPEKNTFYLDTKEVEIPFENFTAKNLNDLLSQKIYVYLAMNDEEFNLVNHYFARENKSDHLQVLQEKPRIVGIKFAEVNEGGRIIMDPLFDERSSHLNPTVRQALNKHLEELKKGYEQFNQIYENKLSEHYKAKLKKDSPEIVLSACRKPRVYVEGFQMEADLYKMQCQVGYFIRDQLRSGLQEAVKQMAPFEIPSEILLEHGDTILSKMLGHDAATRELKKVAADQPDLYSGWDYGLKFTDMHPDLQQMYCDKGEYLDNDNLALVIPLPNLTLYYMLQYLAHVAEHESENVNLNNITQQIAKFVITHKLPLPEKYHTLFDSSPISKNDIDAIRNIYHDSLMQQIQEREVVLEKIKQDDEAEIEYATIVDADEEPVDVVDVKEENKTTEDDFPPPIDLDEDGKEEKLMKEEETSPGSSRHGLFSHEQDILAEQKVKEDHKVEHKKT